MAVKAEEIDQKYMTLLDAVTGAGTGVEYGLRGPGKDFTLQAVDTSLTSGTLDLEGSLDNINWFQLASHIFTAAEILANQAMFHVTNKGVSYIRANLTAYVGTALTVKAIALPTKKER